MKSFSMRVYFRTMVRNETDLYWLQIFLKFGTVMRNFCMSVRSGPEGLFYCSLQYTFHIVMRNGLDASNPYSFPY